jgi:hypothetical protein
VITSLLYFPPKSCAHSSSLPCMLHELEIPTVVLNLIRNEACNFWSLFLQNRLDNFAREMQCISRRYAFGFEVANELTKHKKDKRKRYTNAVERLYFLHFLILRKCKRNFQHVNPHPLTPHSFLVSFLSSKMCDGFSFIKHGHPSYTYNFCRSV